MKFPSPGMTRGLRSWVAFALAAAVMLSVACGGAQSPPSRGVIESDLGGWRFRRFQKLLDTEVWVKGNRGVAFAATYVRGSALRRGRLGDADVVSAVVTRFKEPRAIEPAFVALMRRLARESGYSVKEREIDDAWVIEVRGFGEAWTWWTAGRHVVKVGGKGREQVPEAVVEAYLDRYASALAAQALDAPLLAP
ncbi:MAG TPA: hypothetical protein VFG83_14310 [Kofleriaceae bacterium]|nr:hypothetical protein [Kofleriaceae bacterium]